MFTVCAAEHARWQMGVAAQGAPMFDSGATAITMGDTADLMHGLPRGTRVTLLRETRGYRDERIWLVEGFATSLPRAEVAERGMVDASGSAGSATQQSVAKAVGLDIA